MDRETKRPRRKAIKGTCRFCDKNLTPTPLTKHLATCEKRLSLNKKSTEDHQAASSASSSTTEDGLSRMLHLLVNDQYRPMFFLHLEVREDTTLGKLDDYLHEIWMDCGGCGHLSQFGDFGSRTTPKSTTVGDAFRNKGDELIYLYDMGS
eukprot:CAMPEP_0174242612 /NCGR_PEP_ID=MMETSP0417-20130205/28538_1 /TAXON_ID=242541 /ORGANISM="Mayorella sp, Strain BSH-02190019" /LENGTH=149 /DNA_ID=CAMNT_0015322031 /DNA_START=79 /DNA_END=525 /DNA_ORIENTATION=+